MTVLNPEQLEAVNSIQGPLEIIAGAGSGKTHTVTTRIHNLIKHNVSPDNILAITFTNKAANELKERLNQPRVTACTIHSLCSKILRKWATYIGYQSGFTIMNPDDQKVIIDQIKKDIIAQLTLDAETSKLPKEAIKAQLANNINTVKSIKASVILAKISMLKNRGITPENFTTSIYRDDEQKFAINLFYSKYQEALKENNGMDYDDLLNNTVKLFQEHPSILEAYQDYYLYITVDEFQDVNDTQNTLINMLAAKYQNLCVVGDPDQSIYGWRGAEISNILEFQNTYPNAKIVNLDTNYRSTDPILTLANHVIVQNKSQNRQLLKAHNQVDNNKVYDNGYDDAKPTMILAANSRHEARLIADLIMEDINKNNTTFSDHTILYRNHSFSKDIEQALRQQNIPYRIHGSITFYQRSEIKDLLAYITLLSNPYFNPSLQRIINVPARNLGAATVQQLMTYSQKYGISLMQALQYSEQPELNLTQSKKDSITQFLEVYNNLYQQKDIPLKEVIQTIISKFEYIEFLNRSDSSEDRISNVMSFIEDADKFDKQVPPTTYPIETRVTMFLENIALVVDSNEESSNEDFVTLMTMHSAKGTENTNVYIVGAEQGIIPSAKSYNMIITGKGTVSNTVDEECRLMYVSLTRAKKHLFIFNVEERYMYGNVGYPTRSELLKPIPMELYNNVALENKEGIDELYNKDLVK